jgi:DNA-binding XRE family transcriptional regulator
MRFDIGRPPPAFKDAPKATASFGELLRAYRLRARLSQELLAERAQVSADAVSSLERGTRRSPYRSTVALLVTDRVEFGARGYRIVDRSGRITGWGAATCPGLRSRVALGASLRCSAGENVDPPACGAADRELMRGWWRHED